MDVTIRLLNTMLPMLYALAVVAYAVDFFREDPFAARAARVLMETILGLHALFIGLRTALYEHLPLASTAEVMTTVAFALALVYVFVEWRSKVRKTGMFLITFSFAFQTLSSAFISNRSFPGVLRSPLFALHTVTAVLGYTAFAASAVYGLLFLLLYHELKKSHFGLVYERLPPLEVLARMSLGAVAFGLVFLTATVIFGALWAASEFPGFAKDPKFLLTVAVWTVYLAALLLHHVLHWTGRRTIAVSLVGFALLVFSFLAARLWLASFHVFA